VLEKHKEKEKTMKPAVKDTIPGLQEKKNRLEKQFSEVHARLKEKETVLNRLNLNLDFLVQENTHLRTNLTRKVRYLYLSSELQTFY
jgi:hypothetical protein